MLGGCVTCVVGGLWLKDLGGLLLSCVCYDDGRGFVWSREERVVFRCSVAVCFL